jgi:hypothetical protein
MNSSMRNNMTSLPPPAPGLPPEEWDFSWVTEEILDSVIFYEYARSSPTVLKAFQEWHNKKPKWPPGPKYKNWKNLRVGDAIKKLVLKPNPLGGDVWQILCDGLPEGRWETMIKLLDLSPEFPKPAMLLSHEAFSSNQGREQFETACWVAIKKGDAPSMSQRLAFTAACTESGALIEGWKEFRVLVDTRQPKSRLYKHIAAWLEKLDESGQNKIRNPTGKAAARPWFRLRELSAYRLSVLGNIGFNRVDRYLEKYNREREVKCPNVFPDYTSAGSWSGAVAGAAAYISEIFPVI